jgi:hypothetical protein
MHTGIACAEAEAGLLPRHPTVVVGQQYLLDPIRVPAGAAALWLQLQEVPYTPRGDAAGELDTTHGWTEALAEGYANRVLDRVARHAPELHDKIRAIDVLTPDGLRDRNPNAVSGDPYGGSAELDQSFLWRPLASYGRPATPVGRRWHIGASTHPGAGSRRRLRTSPRDHANQAQGVATLNAYFTPLSLVLPTRACHVVSLKVSISSPQACVEIFEIRVMAIACPLRAEAV